MITHGGGIIGLPTAAFPIVRLNFYRHSGAFNPSFRLAPESSLRGDTVHRPNHPKRNATIATGLSAGFPMGANALDFKGHGSCAVPFGLCIRVPVVQKLAQFRLINLTNAFKSAGTTPL